MSIFIQIAAYRDPQLLITIRDCISNADNPDQLMFGICWQRNENDSLEEFASDSRFKIIDVNFKDSKGACWARNQIQQLYSGETYTLQLDSHHRFVKGWDTILINMLTDLQSKGIKKPLITGYIPSFDPEDDPGKRVNVPWQMNFDRFTPEGVVFFLPASIKNWKELNAPVPARFYSAHFCFTLGQFATEVQHDPDYYFHGEEISITVRAYTHGYDLFHPHIVIAWHEYTRKGRTKHWDDHKDYTIANKACHKRNRVLFRMETSENPTEFGKYGFGTERTVSDYERYAGISFAKRAIQQHTKDNLPPPNPVMDTVEQWEESLLPCFKHCINVHNSKLKLNDYDVIVVALKNSAGAEIYRRDIKGDKLKQIKQQTGSFHNIWVEFIAESMPVECIVWPHSVSQGWGERLVFNI